MRSTFARLLRAFAARLDPPPLPVALPSPRAERDDFEHALALADAMQAANEAHAAELARRVQLAQASGILAAALRPRLQPPALA